MTDTKASHQIIVRQASRIGTPKRTVKTSIVIDSDENTFSVQGVYRCSAGKTTLPFRKIDFAERRRKAFYRRVNALLGGL